MNHSTILLVEDEPASMELARECLEQDGFRVTCCGMGRQALESVRRSPPCLVLLNLNLPDMDGIEVCRQLKWEPSTRHIPIVIVTGRGDEADVVLGLGMGADDYVPKPYRLKELVARVKAAARRHERAQPPAAGDRIERGALVVDRARHEVLVARKPIRLTPTELRVLYQLAAAGGQVLTRARLVQEVSDNAGNVAERTIDAHVQSIRRKLGTHRDLIDTVHGVGYRLAQR
jgi:two-component system phosphate regulon response regulator PhoB